MKKQFMKGTAIVISALTMVSALPCVTASAAATENAFPYAMFAASETEGALTVNAGNFNLNGSIASNGTIVKKGNANINGSQVENAGKEMLFIGGKLTENYFDDAQEFDAIDISDTNISVNVPFVTESTASFDGNVNINAGVKAYDDIHISGNVNNTHNAVIYSEYGDIKIDSSNVSLNGIIYAPLGNVEITAQNINLNDVVIIADTITLNCSNANANYGKKFAKAVGNESEQTRADFFHDYNSKIMKKDIAESIDLLSQYYDLTPVDAGEFAHMNILNMFDFEVQQFEAEGLGNFSIMTTDGLQQMTTYVLTPYDKNAPMVSLDYIYSGDKRTSYVEIYDLVEDTSTEEYQNILADLATMKDKYSSLKDCPEKAPTWYDPLRTVAIFKDTDFHSDAATDEMLFDALRITLEDSLALPELSDEEKAGKLAVTQDYTDKLVDIGGAATNMFKMAMGPEKTKNFFNNEDRKSVV